MGETPLYSDIGATETEPTEIESLCTNCGENGITRLLLTRIPHYKEVILMSFHCEHCGFSNNELQSGSKIQEQGIRIEIRIKTERDLSRQVVKGDYATILVPTIELEIPPTGQRGEISTVEGVISRTASDLEQGQPVRKHMDPEGYQQIEEYIAKVKALLEVKEEFRLIIDDPSGNSFLENPHAPAADPGRIVKHYERSREQNHALGLYSEEELRPAVEEQAPPADDTLTAEKLQEEVLHFATNCPSCNAPAETNMKMTNIPYFKEVVIMATVCESCGHKTNEVKSGGGIEDRGKRITLRLTDPSDLNRDVLKSETCSVAIPELEFEIGGGSLGGRFTTIEGLLNNIQEEIDKNSIWGGGDAAAPDVNARMAVFKEKFAECLNYKRNFTLILDDPAGNSYLQNVYAPEEDPELTVELYERDFDQNDMLGINDMKTENYTEAS